MKRYQMIEVIMVLLVVSFGISGCVGFKAFPLAARSGDTIALALGGSPNHESSPGAEITLDDLDVYITQNGDSYSVEPRYLFRLYPDPTSKVSNFGVYGSLNVGEWSLVLDLVYPGTDTPLPLVEDMQAEVVVNTTKLNSIWNNFGTYEGNLVSIPVYILPGTGESNTFNDNPVFGFGMKDLEPLPQLAISFSGSGSVAAVDLDIDYDEAAISTFNIVLEPSLEGVILNQRLYTDNGNNKMRIMLMTNQGTMSASMMKCFVVWNPTNSGLVTAGSFTVTPKFYNETGDAVTGVSVVKTLLYQ